MKKIKLLLVDDQELIRESLAFVLNTDEDIEVVGLAANGQEAITLCELLSPSIVLMDIQMPVLNGIDATRIVKERWPNIKVMILTTFQEVDYVSEALSIGAEGFLLKAIHPKELISGIKYIHNEGTLVSQSLAKMLLAQINHSKETNEKAYGLTEREVQVLKCLSQGLSNKNISEKLFLSEGTVKNYISSIYHKLDVKNRYEATMKAKGERLI
ncbi:response regulator transcription factor [Lysinibacillus sp. BW-2-10]|uniref:response regulator transcription factor n=1 Tax=Lysinibacillus sp. BW-2-10 TaxID=2590030 RepID=UPI00117E4CEA|nr:response regulator transcription factor [Lysinibacillus sp. BW-2-10]TSI11038.1 response regulator transcription factor [Lysinibacillus sp. BW-2-10]